MAENAGDNEGGPKASRQTSAEDEARSWVIADFDIGPLLGKGQYGIVYSVREKATKHIVAMKIMYVSTLKRLDYVSQFRREVELQYHLRHPNICRLYAYFYDAQRVYIVLERCKHGELFTYLKARKTLPEEETAKFVYQISDALHYCHRHGVIHRDVKPENVLLDAEKNVKLSDFGWSVKHKTSAARRTLCGTLDYLPPEMIANVPHNHKVDNWAVGILMHECLVGRAPFVAPSQEATLRLISSGGITLPSALSAEAKDLLPKLICHNVGQRIELPEAMTHPFITKKYDCATNLILC